jgi:DNA-directed RNA polymerase sigma subunit (sigma70/sigma32)
MRSKYYSSSFPSFEYKTYQSLKLKEKLESKLNNKVTLRNRLAYDFLKELRSKHTLAEISQIYGVSRALINQQYQALETAIKAEEIESKIKH